MCKEFKIQSDFITSSIIHLTRNIGAPLLICKADYISQTWEEASAAVRGNAPPAHLTSVSKQQTICYKVLKFISIGQHLYPAVINELLLWLISAMLQWESGAAQILRSEGTPPFWKHQRSHTTVSTLPSCPVLNHTRMHIFCHWRTHSPAH